MSKTFRIEHIDYVDTAEKKKPDHVNEVPVPGCRLEADVGVGREVALLGPEVANH